MNFYVYAIYNDKGKIYIGYTEDIEKRLARHNNILPHKKSSFTYKQGQNWRLMYSEKCATREEAQTRERQLKTSRGRNYIKQILENLPLSPPIA